MPKMKTHSGAKKRFRVTKNGLIKKARAFRRHHAWAKSPKRILALKGVSYVAHNEARRIHRKLQG